MADGRSQAAWSHTSSLIWIIAEVNRDSKRRSRPYQPADFNPHIQRKKRQRTMTVEDLTHDILKVAKSKAKRTVRPPP